MDVNTNLILMQYFENAADLKPGEFVLLRDGKVIDPLIHGKFTKEHPATIRISDSQYCIADDIRHYFSEGEGYYLVHYHTPQMFPPPPPHHHHHHEE